MCYGYYGGGSHDLFEGDRASHSPRMFRSQGLGMEFRVRSWNRSWTTVHFYYKTSGMEAAAMLADLIENDTGISKEIKMGCELVERESHR